MDADRDGSNGYERVAATFMATRNGRIGVKTVREWSRGLLPGCAVLDLGCGSGVPISQALIEQGFHVHGVDASATLLAAFRARFPAAPAECATVEQSGLFHRTFDGIVAWGLIFLLPPDTQTVILRRVARTLNRGGHFLFTSPEAALSWCDALTGRESISLGREVYTDLLRTNGLTLRGESSDEGDNHYYFVEKR